MKSNFILSIIVLIAICHTILPFVNALETERHSKLLGDTLYNEIHAYELFIKWLNETGLLHLNLNAVENPLEDKPFSIDEKIAIEMLDKVFNNSKIAVFTGSIQLRMLKRYAGFKPLVNESDIIKLIIAIVKNNNMTLNIYRCDSVLDKFIVYITHMIMDDNRESCKLRLDDLESYADYILSLGNLNLGVSDSTMNIIKYLYILRIAASEGSINRQLLNKILEDVSLKYSLVTAIFIKTFIQGYNLEVVDYRSEYKRIENYILTRTTINNTDSNSVNLTEAIIKALQAIEKMRREGMDTKDIDLFKLIDILMNTNIFNVKEYYYSIAYNTINDVNDIYSDTSSISEQNNLHVNSRAGVDDNLNRSYIDNQEHHYLEPWYSYRIEEVAEYSENMELARDAESILNDLINVTLDDKLLLNLFERDIIKEVIEYSNKYSIGVVNLRDTVISPTTNLLLTINKEDSLNNKFYIALLIIISMILGSCFLVISINVKIRPLLKQLTRMPRNFSKSIAVQAKSDDPRIITFTEFWNTIYKFANEFNLKIENSCTHREVKQKLINVLNINRVKIMLEHTTYLYEILRYGGVKDNNLLKELAEALSSIKDSFTVKNNST